jgi:translation initiation factor eIF-2B subunit alpha
VTRAFLELPDFAACIAQVLERGERFADISVHSRDRIAELGQAFVQDGQTVLTHGWSRVVSALLIRAATVHNKHFSLVILEGRPDAGGIKAAKLYADAGIPTTVVLDSAMGHAMESVDLVICGAEGVVENGGIVNKIGTFPLGIVAREMGKPFYVAAESYKFARLFPLNQRDLPDMGGGLANLHFVDTTSWHATATTAQKAPPHRDESMDERERETVRGLVHLPDHVNVENPICDYTPAKYITLLFTDLGVLTPSAVSDELIRLYQ